MRKFINIALLASVALAACGITACSDDNEDNQPAEATISVELSDVLENSLKVIFEPNAYTTHFEYAIGQENNPEAFIEGSMSGIMRESGNSRFITTLNELEPGTVNYLFARAYNSNGQAGPVVTASATTLPVNTAYVSIAVDETGTNSITATFTPNQNTAVYDYAISKINDEQAFIDGTLDAVISDSAQGNSPLSFTFSPLESSSTYYIYTRAHNSDTEAGPVMKAGATTGDRVIENRAAVAIEINSINVISVDLAYIPNEYCNSYYSIVTYPDFLTDNGVSTDEQALEFMDNLYNEGLTYNGVDKSFMTWPLSPYTDFESVCIIVATDHAGNQKLMKHSFTSPAFDASAPLPSMTVEVSEVDLVYNEAYVEFTPDENCLGYYYLIYYASEYDEILNREGEEYMKLLTAQQGTFLFNSFGNWFPFEERDEFIAVGVPINSNGFEGFGELVSVRFSTVQEG